MLRKIGVLFASGAMVTALTACDFTATGSVECHTNDEGKYVCTGQSVATPESTTPPPTEDPEPGDPGGGSSDPGDPPTSFGGDFEAVGGEGTATVSWTTTRTDITGWYVERNGTDREGFGPWGTELPAEARDFRFDLLNYGETYTFTLIAHTERGDLAPVTATATVNELPDGGTPPPAGEDTTAAELYGWGTPIAAASDEFNYVGAPNGDKWAQAGECWAGHAGNGGRCASHSTVNGQALVQHGDAGGDSAWLASKFGQQYGRWEARVKTEALAEAGNTYHPLLIVWPDSDRWPHDGEYDFFENFAPEANSIQSFIHYPHSPDVEVQQEFAKKDGVDTGKWHNIAFEWTPDYVKGFIDGQEWFTHSGGANGVRSNIQDMPSGHLTIQLDNFHGSGMQPANYYVDWVRTYALN